MLQYNIQQSRSITLHTKQQEYYSADNKLFQEVNTFQSVKQAESGEAVFQTLYCQPSRLQASCYENEAQKQGFAEKHVNLERMRKMTNTGVLGMTS